MAAATKTPDSRPGLPPKQQSKNMSATQILKQRPSRLSMEGYIYNADKVLEIALDPTTREIPTDLVERCKGVAILSIFHIGALMTMHYGTGVVMAKNPPGAETKWSAPSACLVNGYSMGALLGGKADSTLVFIMNDETMKDFVHRPQTRMGLDAALAIGKMGGDKTVGIDGKGTISFAYTSGAFAGLSLQMGTLVHQAKQNEVFYNKEKVEAKDIVLSNTAVQVPSDCQVGDMYKKLDLLEQGMTWVPTPEDMDRSSRFLEGAQSSSQRFTKSQLAGAA
ncbi:YSC84-like protein 1 [Seminavis robusta]|uniref:YSC84-like protein 1 n=1 Tax=Seminavis robusta TaxID=568900 RepID=A0A9N8H899_9STRA|nr:YSC84-like protein 1 [Seminavis robusta]|eukprot:Sro85_g045530.1 YSC84-like protein 1 (279) ;mRNA; r:120327-121163